MGGRERSSCAGAPGSRRTSNGRERPSAARAPAHLAHVGRVTDVSAARAPALLAHVGRVTDVTDVSAARAPSHVAHVGSKRPLRPFLSARCRARRAMAHLANVANSARVLVGAHAVMRRTARLPPPLTPRPRASSTASRIVSRHDFALHSNAQQLTSGAHLSACNPLMRVCLRYASYAVLGVWRAAARLETGSTARCCGLLPWRSSRRH